MFIPTLCADRPLSSRLSRRPLIAVGISLHQKRALASINAVAPAADDVAGDDVLAKQARVHLLFGGQSATGIAATGVGSQLRNMVSVLERRPDSIRDNDAMSMYSRNFDGALEQHERFTRAARAALKETWWQRIREFEREHRND